jgi:hypothetical protein
MITQLFVGFIAYTIEQLGDSDVNSFQDELESLINELQDTEPALISWYSDLKDYWLEQVSEEDVEEGEESFLEFVKSMDIEKIVELATDIRNELMLDDVPNLTYGIDHLSAIFLIKWKDGMQIEIKCDPSFPEEAKKEFEFDASKLDELLSAFKQQIVELIIKPGFDSLHDQTATVFPLDKYRELYAVLSEYVNSKNSVDRADYDLVLKRFRHFFDDDIAKLWESTERLKWLDNGGGF